MHTVKEFGLLECCFVLQISLILPQADSGVPAMMVVWFRSQVMSTSLSFSYHPKVLVQRVVFIFLVHLYPLMFCNSSVASHIPCIYQWNWHTQLIFEMDIINSDRSGSRRRRGCAWHDLQWCISFYFWIFVMPLSLCFFFFFFS